MFIKSRVDSFIQLIHSKCIYLKITTTVCCLEMRNVCSVVASFGSIFIGRAIMDQVIGNILIYYV